MQCLVWALGSRDQLGQNDQVNMETRNGLAGMYKLERECQESVAKLRVLGRAGQGDALL
jgi:hypothetical protein